MILIVSGGSFGVPFGAFGARSLLPPGSRPADMPRPRFVVTCCEGDWPALRSIKAGAGKTCLLEAADFSIHKPGLEHWLFGSRALETGLSSTRSLGFHRGGVVYLKKLRGVVVSFLQFPALVSKSLYGGILRQLCCCRRQSDYSREELFQTLNTYVVPPSTSTLFLKETMKSIASYRPSDVHKSAAVCGSSRRRSELLCIAPYSSRPPSFLANALWSVRVEKPEANNDADFTLSSSNLWPWVVYSFSSCRRRTSVHI